MNDTKPLVHYLSIRLSYLDKTHPPTTGKPRDSRVSIYNRGRYSINQQLIMSQQMLKHWSINLFPLFHVVWNFGAFIVDILSFNLADLYWPKEKSNSIRLGTIYFKIRENFIQLAQLLFSSTYFYYEEIFSMNNEAK